MPSNTSKAAKLRVVPNLPEKEVLVDPDACDICYGTGVEIVPGKGARPCQCRTQNTIDPLERSRVPVRYLDATFDNFVIFDRQTGAINPYLERAKDKALSFVKRFPDVEQGLLFLGNVGVGKTHLAISVLKSLVAKTGAHCLFYDFGWLIKEIQDSYNPNTQASELRLLQRVIDAEVLVLDEIGSAKSTEWVKDTLMNIINTRYNMQRLTLFTTNYLDEDHSNLKVDRSYVQEQILRREGRPDNLESLKRQFASYTERDWERLIRNERLSLRASEETLTERIGYRLRSRIYEMSEEIYIQSPDFRQQFQKKSTTRIPR